MLAHLTHQPTLGCPPQRLSAGVLALGREEGAAEGVALLEVAPGQGDLGRCLEDPRVVHAAGERAGEGRARKGQIPELQVGATSLGIGYG